MRQCQVLSITPIEPHPLYNEDYQGKKSSRSAENSQWVAVSEYFWPLERSRVISAWKRGDFSEAELWLKSHQSRYRFLYQLAGYLKISNNWEIAGLIKNKEFESGATPVISNHPARSPLGGFPDLKELRKRGNAHQDSADR